MGQLWERSPLVEGKRQKEKREKGKEKKGGGAMGLGPKWWRHHLLPPGRRPLPGKGL